uniref:Uncharacterized protein n=1 Tax=Rhizophora mucronata TaxID=61149 RepID=A0A2P2LVU0_RHIMU
MILLKLKSLRKDYYSQVFKDN